MTYRTTPDIFQRRGALSTEGNNANAVQGTATNTRNLEAFVDELADRINAPVDDDPLLHFDSSMSRSQIGDQLRALRDKARSELAKRAQAI